MLSIGEFSKITRIPRSKLIYYDDLGLFPSAYRGENNYRYYTLNQIILASFINDMASFGVSLKELLPLVQNRTPEIMLEVLEKSIKEHHERALQLKETQSVMEVLVDLMKQGLAVADKDFEIIDAKPYRLIIGSENVYQDAPTFYPAWMTFINSAKKAGLNIKFPIGGIFNDLDRFIADPNMPSRFYFVNPRGKNLVEGGKWLAGYVRGFYGVTGDLVTRLLEFAEENKLKLTGPVYNTFLLDEMSLVDPDQYMMRATIKIEE